MTFYKIFCIKNEELSDYDKSTGNQNTVNKSGPTYIKMELVAKLYSP